MSMDVMTLAFKAMGFDPSVIMGQAQQLGTAFAALADGQKAAAEALARLEANQLAIMTTLGLAVPLPDGDMAALIAVESRKFLDEPVAAE